MIDAANQNGKWRAEAKALMALSVPLVIGNVGWAAIAATDLLWLGRRGPDSVAAGALGMNLHTAFMIFGIGLTTAASPLIASERGRKLHSVRDIRRTVRQSMWAAMAFCVPCWLIMWHAEALLILMGQEPELATAAGQLVHGVQWALLPYLCYLVLRNYVSSLERPMWGVIVMLATIPFNAAMGWILIFGHLGMPALGLFGAGLASTLSCFFMFFGMIAVILIDRQFRRYHLLGRFWVADWHRLRTIWAIGLPIAVTLAFEVTVFNAAVFLMGLLGRAQLAAHSIAIQIAALCFMVPLGIAQAATVRVGFAFGQGDHEAAGRAGWLALMLGTAFAVFSGTLLIGAPRWLVGEFIDLANPANARVVHLATSFLAVAALFQLVDCAQAIGAGALRGMQDTRVPMIFAAIGYWVIGIGSGIVMAFPLGMGGMGIWLGLAIGLGVVAVLMVTRWAWRERLGLMTA